jgi:SAM-dependent methyltransferase
MIAYFDPKYIDYILLQRTRLKTEYSLSKDSNIADILNALNEMTEKDFKMIQPYIIPPLGDDYFKERTILDIGCGLGTIDVFISNYYPMYRIFVQDKTQEIDTGKKYNGFNTEYHYYNNLELLANFLTLNGLSDYLVIDGEKLFNINEKFDVIMSLLSCGWHYSLTTYLDFIKTHLSENGKLIIDVRNDTEEALLYDTFHNVFRIFNENEKRHDGGIVGYRYVCSKQK